MRIRAIAAASAVAAVTYAVAADAHVVADPNQAAAGAYFRTAFRVPHGCDGASTVAVRIQLPDGVHSAKPQMKAGWTVEIVMRQLEKPVDLGHGRTATETVGEVIWRGGPLPDGQFDEFGLVMKLPKRAGETIYFPTVQECETGERRWIEIPAKSDPSRHLRSPAPAVKLTDGGHGSHH